MAGRWVTVPSTRGSVSPPDPVDEAAEHLYGVPFADFVEERKTRAKELRSAGEKEAAAEVAKLPKPSQVAWAANHFARAGDADELLEAGARLREVQLGGGDREEVREAAAAERKAVEALVKAADLSRAQQDRLRTLLHALASDDDLRAAFEAGRLVKEPEPGGWPTGEFTAVPRRSPPKARAKGQAAAKPAKPSKRDEERERKAAQRREREAARKREEAERRKWERRLQAAREQAEEAKRRLEAAREAYESATHEVARIEEQLG
jgi:hypothetical protein